MADIQQPTCYMDKISLSIIPTDLIHNTASFIRVMARLRGDNKA